MKSIFFSVCLLVSSLVCLAQYSFVKQWDYRYGGTKLDLLEDCIQTSNGNYLLAGGSDSRIGGDKTQDNWDTVAISSGYDYWVVLADANGQKIWDKRFGGLGPDGFWRALQTFDGSFILAGQSALNPGGDASEVSRGGFDYWIIKIDTNGNKLWDKRFGGPGSDELRACVQTRDSGFLLAGSTYSGAGGDKQQASWGGTDYWAVKTDAQGNLQWEKRFGGLDYDFLYDAVQTADGGYLLGGYSNSGEIGGDKTEPNFHDMFNHYSDNFWVIKIDSAGNKVWDHVYGGTDGDHLGAMLALPDNTCVLGGSSYSGISGNKTTPVKGGPDYWLVKIDSAGGMLWDRDYGSLSGSQLERLTLTKDGGYLLSGGSYSASPFDGDKSESNPIVAGLPWILKTDLLGNKQWDKTIFLNEVSYVYAPAIETQDGCYAVGVFTGSEIGYYKTQASWDSSTDYWLMKFCMEEWNGLTPTLSTGGEGGIQMQVWPNPFGSDLSIAVLGEDIHEARFSITDALGRVVYEREESNLAKGYTKVLDLSYLPNGIYFIVVQSGGEVMSKRVVKE